MKLSILFRSWWVILIQGILMIALSILIFRNPAAVLSAAAFYLGLIVLISGAVGMIAYFANPKNERDLFTLLGSAATLLVGLMMISNLFVTAKAITILFGLLVCMVGLVLLSGSWNHRKSWSMWWIIALLGIFGLSIGIKSMLDVYAGAENISNMIGIAVLLSGTGLICLAFLKKKILSAIKNKL
jgi:uncharacterized membrane protein HdeD (DUF308 family)